MNFDQIKQSGAFFFTKIVFNINKKILICEKSHFSAHFFRKNMQKLGKKFFTGTGYSSDMVASESKEALHPHAFIHILTHTPERCEERHIIKGKKKTL